MQGHQPNRPFRMLETSRPGDVARYPSGTSAPGALAPRRVCLFVEHVVKTIKYCAENRPVR